MTNGPRHAAPVQDGNGLTMHWKPLIRTLPLVLLLLCAGMVAHAQDQKANVVAVVLRINGSLQYRENDNADWKTASVPQELFDGWQVRTAIGNRAVVQYTSGTRILVNENTHLEVTAQKPGTASPERTRLLVGEVFSQISAGGKPAAYEYEVETPSSVASVRGTQFDSQHGDGVSTFISMENDVEVMNQLGTVLLHQYYMTTVRQGEQPSDPANIGRDQASRLTNWTERIEPTWKLNVVPQGGTNQIIGQPFTLAVYAIDPATNSVVDASFELTRFAAEPAGLEFSVDGGRTWVASPTVIMVNGFANISARNMNEGTAAIIAEAADSEPGRVQVSVAARREQKDVRLLYTQPNGSGESTLILRLEEKQ